MRFKASAARSLLAGLVLALSAATALPQTTSLYTVEIIVFRNAGDEGALPPNAVLPTVLDDGIEVTSATPSRLNTAARKLESSGDFKVLARAAWTQGPSAWPQGVAWTSCPGASATQLGINNGINGKVYLLRRDQLNLGLDLVFEEGGRRFQLQEVRTVRSNAINYFDHPAFGVLAIISAAGN